MPSITKKEKLIISSNREERAKKEIFYQLLLITIIVLLYSVSWNYPIYGGWDDGTYILKNPNLALSLSNIVHWFKHPCVGCYLPATMLSYMFDYNIWGLNSFGYHLQNIFWHVVATLAIYNCFRLFNIKSWIAFFLCLIFAVHPQRVESVVWLSERKDVLCAAFYFLSIYFYIKNYDKKFSFIAFACFIISMLSKSMAVSLPVILLMYEFYKQKHFNIKYYIIRLWPYIVLLAVLIPVTFASQQISIRSNLGISSFSAQKYHRVLFNLFWYFKQAFCPNELCPIYPLISTLNTLLGLTVFYIFAIIVTAMTIVKSKRFFLYKMLPITLCYIASLFPVISFVLVGATDHADRYSYIPSVFIWFALGLILSHLLYDKQTTTPSVKKQQTSFLLNKKFVFFILFVYSIILIEMNYRYQKIWYTNYSVFIYAAENQPTNPLALIYLGDLELEIGNYKNVLKIANQLKLKDKGNLLAAYLKASATYHLGDRDNSLKILSNLTAYYKPLIYKNSDAKFRYLKILDMLINGYHSIGKNQESIKYINEALNYKQLSKEKRSTYLKLKNSLSK